MPRAAVLATLLILLLSGCAAPGSTLKPAAADVPAPVGKLYNLSKVIEASIPLSDGPKLHGTVYLPDVPEGLKVPVVMDLGPYYGNLGSDTNVYSKEHPPSLLYEHFLRRGYAIALVSLRGTGQSEGCFAIGGPQERQDAALAVEWLAGQSWSNGKVGMAGVSYDGTTPWEAMAGGAPHLAAIVPGEGITDHYRYSFFDGVPIGGGSTFNTYYSALVDWAYTNPNGVPGWAAAQPSNACPGTVDVLKSPYDTYQDGAHSAFWDARDSSALLRNSTVPVFIVHGFVDFNVKMDNVQTIWDKLGGPRYARLGQWEHNIPWSNSYNHDWDDKDYNATIDNFLDAYLRDDAAAKARLDAMAPVTAQDSRGAWHNLTRWPPEGTNETALYLAPRGEMAWSAPSESEKPTFVTAGGVTEMLPVDAAPSSLVFHSESLREPLLVMGNPTLNVTLSVSRPHAWVVLSLRDVDATGAGSLVSQGWLNLAERDGRESAKPVPTDTPMTVRVNLLGTAHVFEAGHRLELTIRGTSDGTPGAPQDAPVTTLLLAPGTPASLALPLAKL